MRMGRPLGAAAARRLAAAVCPGTVPRLVALRRPTTGPRIAALGLIAALLACGDAARDDTPQPPPRNHQIAKSSPPRLRISAPSR